MKEQAKQWLSAGKGWLSDASKKVAQAVKETQAQINNKIDELDNRQGGNLAYPEHLYFVKMTNKMYISSLSC